MSKPGFVDRLRQWFSRRPAPITLEEAVERFLEDPIASLHARNPVQGRKGYAYGDMAPLLWPPREQGRNLQDITAIVGGHTIGHVEYLTVEPSTQFCRIGHIATSAEVRELTLLHRAQHGSSLGVGSALLWSLCDELADRYGIKTFIFDELSVDNKRADYRAFFPAVGATLGAGEAGWWEASIEDLRAARQQRAGGGAPQPARQRGGG